MVKRLPTSPHDPLADVETIVEEFDEPAVEVTAEKIRHPSVDDVDKIIEQVLDETAHTDEEDHGVGTSDVGDQPAGTADDSVPWFDLPYEVLIARDSERAFETASDTEDEEMETIVVGDQQLQTVDAAVSRADAAADYFVEEPVEETETKAGELSADEAKSVEDILMTIPVDVPLPFAGVEITKITLGKDIKIPGVDERTWYLASLPQIRVDDKGKEPLVEKDPVKGNPVKEQVLLILDDIECLVQLREKIIDDVDRFFNSFSFKKLDSLKVEDISAKEELVLSWKINFIPGDGASAIDLKVLDRLSDIHSFVLEELKEHEKSHGLMWKKTCCSKFFEGRPRDRGVVIARTNTNTPSKCWIRTMILVDGVWVVEPCSDHWVKIPKPIVHNEVPRQLSYEDTLPAISTFFKLMKKRWADVCLAVGDFFVPENCYQTLLWQRLDAQSEDIMHIGDSHNDVLSRLNTLDKGLHDALLQQGEDLRKLIQNVRQDGRTLDDVQTLRFNEFRKGEDLRKLIQNVRQDGRTLDDVQTLRFNEFRKGFLALSAAVTTDSMDFRKEFRALNAKVTSLDEQVAATRSDLLEFSAQAQETLNHITDQLSELIAYINRGGNDKNGEVSTSRPQPPPDDQNRGSGNTGGDNVRTTDIVDRFSDSMSREGRGRGRSGEKRGSGNKSGSSKRRHYSSSGGPFRRSFEDWLG
ncbi:gamma-glutamyltranspeptidase 1-like [Dorcoceras hygrometricum]|uniref:Gamma-glutamyltranspeptidase 1-like n=1 Tax=Dorcoceras hygrometricum TaxID=472368 RepID=A0A2Z7BW03_9LAMI|nr:gamma-glutamyltranspeptidase 1-like [Dorcoceras hygrometricum]